MAVLYTSASTASWMARPGQGRMQMVVLCFTSLTAWKRNTVRLDVFVWLIVQILINFSQVLASYLAKYFEYYLTCLSVV